MAPGTELRLSSGATINNAGTIAANAEYYIGGEGTPASSIVNTGLFEKTEGAWELEVVPSFVNLGTIKEVTGHFIFRNPDFLRARSALYGGKTPGEPTACAGDPVSCATGDLTEEQTDFAVGGRGVGLDMTRVYNSQAAAEETKGIFGYGWSSSFSDHLVVEKEAKRATVIQAGGNTVPFTESESKFLAPVWTQDTLSGSAEAGYTLTLADQVKYKFAGGGGRLESVTDRDGNVTTLSYSEAGQADCGHRSRRPQTQIQIQLGRARRIRRRPYGSSCDIYV